MFGFLDQIMKRMGKKWVASKMPELKNQELDQLIGIYLKSSHCKKLVMEDKLKDSKPKVTKTQMK